MDTVDQRILDAIKTKPGQKAKEIAAQLGVDRKTVNSALYGRLKGKVKQDKSYQWYPKDAIGVEARDEGPKQLDTPLARLCRYYLDCLSHDDLGGVSEFASSKYGDPNYVELHTLPMCDEEADSPFDSDAGRHLLGRIRRDRNRQTVFLGYPVRLNLIRSRKGWEGYMVEPLLLFPFQEAESRHGTPTLTDDLPQINFRALRALSNVGKTGLLEEAIQLAEELGLSNAAADQPDLDELTARLREIRSDWDWQEDIDPCALSSSSPLSELNEQGIFNRAILIAAERSRYTKGLESELGMLQSVEESKYRDTAAGTWLTGGTIESPATSQQPLLEVLPLNSEQRQAVRQALCNPLTVITGPPGTGKSQVVTSILVNAAWQGKTVLFASKNNKAVDVVEVRVNALGPRPVLLRLGANQYQSRLAEYLVAMLAATATADDHERYRECESIHCQLQERSGTLDEEVALLVALRNDVDRLEQQVEQIRQELGGEMFRRLKSANLENLHQAVARIQAAIDQADRAKQPFLIRLLWPLVRDARFSQLASAGESFRQVGQYIEVPIPEARPDKTTIVQWIQYRGRVGKRASQMADARRYFGKLATLTKARSLEELSRQRKDLTEELARNSEALWQAWLRLQPSRMSPEQRRLLGDYSALLQMIVSANDQNQQLGRDVFRRYY